MASASKLKIGHRWVFQLESKSTEMVDPTQNEPSFTAILGVRIKSYRKPKEKTADSIRTRNLGAQGETVTAL